MIHPIGSHGQYLADVQARRAALGVRVPHDATPLWCIFRQADLSAAGPILTRMYAATRGRPARDPVALLRAHLLMHLCRLPSVTDWVARLHEQPFYALLAGLDPDDLPGVGTFYDFQDRLLQLTTSSLNREMTPRRRSEDRKRDGSLQDKNNTAPHVQILERWANRVMYIPDRAPAPAPAADPAVDPAPATDPETPRAPRKVKSKVGSRGQRVHLHLRPRTPAPYGEWAANLPAFPLYQQILQELFYTVFVATSVQRGLIDLAHLCVAGDGTHLTTWANPRGHKLCQCDNHGKRRAEHCSCARRFHDPQASWGWDSYRKCYVYGHGLYELTAYSLQHTCQLPLLITLVDNHRHDSVAYLAAMHCAVDALGFPIKVVSLDKAHDALALYRLGAEWWHLDSVIPLNARSTGDCAFPPPSEFTPDGVPLCPAGQPMAHDGFDYYHQRHKWRCPLAARDQRNARRPPHAPAAAVAKPPIDCPHFAQDCSDSPYGRTVYTFPRDNYRWFPRLRRGSLVWERHADYRSCAERSVKRKKLDFGLADTRVAGRERWFLRAMLTAMCQHLDAWATRTELAPASVESTASTAFTGTLATEPAASPATLATPVDTPNGSPHVTPEVATPLRA